jgi:hypothetical protein
MSTSSTRRAGGAQNQRFQRDRRHRRALRDRRWSHRLAWLMGGALACLGALAGAFGTVAWLTVLCASSFPRVMFGIVTLGVLPVVGGGVLLWAGLSVLEAESSRSRVRAISDERFVEAVRSGATGADVALRLGVGETLEVENRLDELVARDVLALEVTDEGEVLYRSRSM